MIPEAAFVPGQPPPAWFGLETVSYVVEQSLDAVLMLNAQGRFTYVNPAFCRLIGYARDELIGRPFLELIAPHRREQMIANFQRSLAGNPGRRSTVATRADGDERDIEYTSMLFESGGQQLLAAIVRDVTELKREARKARALARVAGEVTLDQPLEERIDRLAETIIEATTAVACVVALVGREPGQLLAMRAREMPPGYLERMEAAWPAASNLPTTSTATALRTQQTELLAHVRALVNGVMQVTDPRFSALDSFDWATPWDSIIYTPLVYRGRSLGVIISYHFIGSNPSTNEATFLRAIADQAAVVVEHVRLLEEVRKRATLEERQRLARELHDSVSQALYGIVLGVKTAKEVLARDPAQAAAALDYVLRLAEAGLAEMRAILFELRPESLEQEGLVVALEKQAASLRVRRQIEVVCELGDEPVAPLAIKEALYRVAQEGLQNIIEHAHARRVRLQLLIEPDAVVLDLHDDGVGFSSAATDDRGLQVMRDRIHRVGGQIEIASVPGIGTRVLARVPVDQPKPPALPG